MNITLSKARLPKSEYPNLHLEHLLVALVMTPTHPIAKRHIAKVVLRAHWARSQGSRAGVWPYLVVTALA